MSSSSLLSSDSDSELELLSEFIKPRWKESSDSAELAVLSSDDEWKPESLAKMHKALAALETIVSDKNASRKRMYATMLHCVLDITSSEYGYVGEHKVNEETGELYLAIPSYALTNIAWSDATTEFYKTNQKTGFNFYNLNTLFGAVITTQDVVISNAPHADPKDERSSGVPPGHPPLTAYMGIPLRVGTRVIGSVGLANRPGGFKREHADFLKPFLQACANAMVVNSLEATAHELREHIALKNTLESDMRWLREASERIRDVPNHDAILNAVVELIHQRFAPECSAVYSEMDHGTFIMKRCAGKRKEDIAIAISGSIAEPEDTDGLTRARQSFLLEKFIQCHPTLDEAVGNTIAEAYFDLEAELKISIAKLEASIKIARRRGVASEASAEDTHASVAALREQIGHIPHYLDHLRASIGAQMEGMEQQMHVVPDPAAREEPTTLQAGKMHLERLQDHLDKEQGDEVDMSYMAFREHQWDSEHTEKVFGVAGCGASVFLITWGTEETGGVNHGVLAALYPKHRKRRKSSHGESTRKLNLMGDLVKVVELALDQAQRVNQQHKLEVEKAATMSLNRAKTLFLSQVSHELKTPLLSILHNVEELQDTRLTATQSHLLADVRRGSEQLNALVSNVMDFITYEADAMQSEAIQLNAETASLNETIEAVFAVVAPEAARKGISIQYDVSPGVLDSLEMDTTRLKQVLVNILGNSIKFTPQSTASTTGRVHLVVKEAEAAPRDTPESQRLQFVVTDTGVGIAKKFVDRVFDMFYQVDDSRDGVGMGLAICQHLVRLMDGDIAIKSRLGKGSALTFTACFHKPAENLTNLRHSASHCSTGVEQWCIAAVMVTRDAGLLNSAASKLRRIHPTVKHIIRGVDKLTPSSMDVLMSEVKDANRFLIIVDRDRSEEWLNSYRLGPLHEWTLSPEFKACGCVLVLEGALMLSTLSTLVKHWTISTPNANKAKTFAGGGGGGGGGELRHSHHNVQAEGRRGSRGGSSSMHHSSSSSTSSSSAPAHYSSTHSSGGEAAAPPAVTDSSASSSKKASGSGDGNKRRAGGRVLVVDDNRINRKIISKMLSRVDLECEMANSGMKAFELLKDKPYNYINLILMDLHMPSMGGIEVTRMLIDHFGDALPPVVAITATSSAGELKKCLAVGMKTILSKPVTMKKFKEVVFNHME